MTSEKGRRGEDKACSILTRLGFVIIERNYFSKYGEIDIIAKRRDMVHFIEVKTTYGSFNPAENFHRRKLQRFMKTVRVYCFMNNITQEHVQIDLALVDLAKRVFNLIEHPQAYFD